MINPDGVYHGHYRMDIYNQNLNRYYKKNEFFKQPAIYGVTKLMDYFHAEKRLFFYMDLHSHYSRKACFIYGNSMDDFAK